MKTSGLNLSGQGDVNLPAYSINYRITPQMVRNVQGAGGATTSQNGLAVPFIISGSLDNPSYRPDVQGALQNALQNPKALHNSVGAIKDQIKSGKGGLNLKGLLGGQGN